MPPVPLAGSRLFWVGLHCACPAQLAYPSPADGHPGCSQGLAPSDTLTRVFLWTCAFPSLGSGGVSRSSPADSEGSPCRTLYCFPKWCLPASSVSSSSSSALSIVHLLMGGHSRGCEVEFTSLWVSFKPPVASGVQHLSCSS